MPMFNFVRPFHKHTTLDIAPSSPPPSGEKPHARSALRQVRAHTVSKDNDTDTFSPFFHSSPDLMIRVDETGFIQMANPAFYTQLGLDTHYDISQIKLSTLFSPDSQATVRRHIRQSAFMHTPEDTPSVTFEADLTYGASAPVPIAWTCHVHKGSTYITGRDLSYRADHTQALARGKEQLIQAESIGRFGRWEWVLGAAHLEWSDEIYRIFGVSRHEFTPDMPSIYGMLNEDDRDRMDQTFERAVINQTPFDLEFSCLRPDGQRRFMRCEGRCTVSSDGEVIALYGIMQDMSERIIYENELRAAKDHAEKACAARTQFLANMSHELRTPLNAIIGFSEMIEGEMLGPVGQSKYTEYAGDIRKSGAFLLDMISDILDMSKLEAGKYELEKSAICLTDIIQSAMTMIRPRADEKAIALTCPSDRFSHIILDVDRRACLQILLNLLSNAVKFTPAQGTISVHAHTDAGQVTLSIADSGIGIPAAKLASITQPFEQVVSYDTREHEGYGLGLAITKELLELHGGTLELSSKVNAGTTAIITLPLAG